MRWLGLVSKIARSTLGSALLVSVASVAGAAARDHPAPVQTGSLRVGRSEAPLTLLRDGRALLAGGRAVSSRHATAEVYDPTTGQWSETEPLSAARAQHTATLLADGQVLVAGGLGPHALRTAMRYDPDLEKWLPAGSLRHPRYHHTAAHLGNGKVLVAGGQGGDGATAEVYDPATDRWSLVGSLAFPRYLHESVVLEDGRVLVAGGAGPANARSAEVFDPRSGSWSPTAPLTQSRIRGFSMTLLADGRVLVAGGTGRGATPRAEAEIYDPATGRWTPTTPLPAPRASHSAALRLDGTVLLAGGRSVTACHTSALLFDATTEAWQTVNGHDRIAPRSVRLPDGRILVAGGGEGGPCALDPSEGRASFLFGVDDLPDLVVTGLVPPIDASPGEAIPLPNGVQNGSGATTGAFRVGLYLSADNVCSTDDTLMGSRDVGPLGPNESSFVTSLVTIPVNAALGPQNYACAIVDDLLQVAESDEGNNTRSVQILIVSPTPVVTLRVNGLHPDPPIVTTSGPVKLTLEVSPYTSYEGELYWFWAFVFADQLYWVTPAGVSTTPAPLLRSPPFGVSATLLDVTLAPGSSLTNVFFLWNGAVVSFDWITATAQP
jgi:hypothetical protein